jgi:glycosyltransferase involved in cell wall biosynthesis
MRFSIITINYNNALGLIKTIESVKIQLFNDFEFIIIDGNSSDNSKEVIKENLNSISYWVSENDNGVYHAMNKGLKIAKGEYCIFLNSGDYFYNSNVLFQVTDSILNNSVLVYGLIAWENQKQLWNPRRDLKDFEMAFTSLIPHQG